MIIGPGIRTRGRSQRRFILRKAGIILTLVLAAFTEKSRADSDHYSAELVFPLETWHNHGSCIVECPNGDLLVWQFRSPRITGPHGVGRVIWSEKNRARVVFTTPPSFKEPMERSMPATVTSYRHQQESVKASRLPPLAKLGSFRAMNDSWR